MEEWWVAKDSFDDVSRIDLLVDLRSQGGGKALYGVHVFWRKVSVHVKDSAEIGDWYWFLLGVKWLVRHTLGFSGETVLMSGLDRRLGSRRVVDECERKK